MTSPNFHLTQLLCNLVDMEDFTRYYALQMYIANQDRGLKKNTAFWRARTEENVPVVLMKDVKAPFIPEQAYTGEEYTLDTLKDRNGGKLAFAVLYKSMELTPGTDYEAVFTDARDAGTATLILRGLNNTGSKTGLSFVGEKRITFKIAGLQISKTKINGLEKSYAYTGEEITPAVTLTADGRPVPADDFAAGIR